MEEATDTRPDATFHCDTETYILLIYGRLNLDTDLASGRLMIEGDHEAAKAFQQWFRGI
jgi:predicted lipid carrier protein YhbT